MMNRCSPSIAGRWPNVCNVVDRVLTTRPSLGSIVDVCEELLDTFGRNGITVKITDIREPEFVSTQAVPAEQTSAGTVGEQAPDVRLWSRSWNALLSTQDLFGRAPVLLVGAAGQRWIEAVRSIADRTEMDLFAHCIGGDGDLVDVEGCWNRAYGVTSTGAVLVLRDGSVGWRAKTLVEDPEGALERALASSYDDDPAF